MECEKNGCFLIMCLMLEGEEILNIKKLKIEIRQGNSLPLESHVVLWITKKEKHNFNLNG